MSIDKKNSRNSSFELLRILAMVMIISHHFAIHGGFIWEPKEVTIPHFWVTFLSMGGKIGVNIFILISGYFLINDKKIFDGKKIAKLEGQILFYSLFFYALFLILGIEKFSISNTIKCAFPLTYNQWWFASSYFVLFLLHPFINILLTKLEKRHYQIMLLLLVFIWSIIPTFTKRDYQGNAFLWFVLLYAIAGYIRLHGFKAKWGAMHFAFLVVFAILITYIISACFIVLGSRSNIFFKHIDYLFGWNKITVLVIAFSIFMFFVRLSIENNNIINFIISISEVNYGQVYLNLQCIKMLYRLYRTLLVLYWGYL